MGLLEEVKDNVGFILEDVANLDVANHSSVGPEWVTVADMADPAIARNNCWATSGEIYEYTSLNTFADSVEEIDIVGVEAPGCTHYAVYLANSTEQVVIDFTVRQFSPDAPFPFVLSLDSWHAYMQHVTNRELVLSIGE